MKNSPRNFWIWLFVLKINHSNTFKYTYLSINLSPKNKISKLSVFQTSQFTTWTLALPNLTKRIKGTTFRCRIIMLLLQSSLEIKENQPTSCAISFKSLIPFLFECKRTYSRLSSDRPSHHKHFLNNTGNKEPFYIQEFYLKLL